MAWQSYALLSGSRLLAPEGVQREHEVQHMVLTTWRSKDVLQIALSMERLTRWMYHRQNAVLWLPWVKQASSLRTIFILDRSCCKHGVRSVITLPGRPFRNAYTNTSSYFDFKALAYSSNGKTSHSDWKVCLSQNTICPETKPVWSCCSTISKSCNEK